ncbi:hypothetical protein C0991_001060 [Blastosporella zonata]|nr:hypothetical protein C0991_001060 [Blastosporella zonata]
MTLADLRQAANEDMADHIAGLSKVQDALLERKAQTAKDFPHSEAEYSKRGGCQASADVLQQEFTVCARLA